MSEKIRAKNLKLGLKHVAEKAYQASPYPFVKKFWPGFSDLNPGMQQGLITTELGAEFAMMTLACYGSVAIATQPTTSEGPSTLGPKITKENFDTEVKTGQINPYLQETSKKFLKEISQYVNIFGGNLDTFEFMSTVKVDESGKVTTDKFSFDFNDQISGPDGVAKDYLVHNSFVLINNKDGGSGLYLYTQLIDEEGKVGTYGFVDAEGKQHVVPNLNKVVTFPDESNPKNAIVYTNVDGYLYPLLQVENAYDETGTYIGGKIVGFNHVTGERNEPIVDNLVGAVGIANLTADTEGNLISALGIFGDPAINAPPTPEFINIKYVSSTQNNGSEIVVTPTYEVPATEAPATIKLDKPMTTEFDLLNTDVMPSTDEGMVRTGQLNEAVRQYWQETGLINPDGTPNKPENVIPAKPDQWRILYYPGDPTQNIPGGDLDLGPNSSVNDPNRYAPMMDKAFQPTDLLFKVVDKAGEVTGILVTEALYYIDPSGKVAIEPVFFFVDISKTSNPILPKLLGHEKFSDGDIILCFPYVGLQDGEEGNEFIISRFIEDKDAFLREPMQEDREAFARQVDVTGNPKGMGDFWWAGIVIAKNSPK